jgi:hypothetical protein
MKKIEEKEFFDLDEFNDSVKVDEGTTSSIISSENNPKGLTF